MQRPISIKNLTLHASLLSDGMCVQCHWKAESERDGGQ